MSGMTVCWYFIFENVTLDILTYVNISWFASARDQVAYEKTVGVNEKTKDKSENVNIHLLTISSIESLLVTIQKLWRDIIATPIDVEKLTNLPKIRGTKIPISKLTR